MQKMTHFEVRNKFIDYFKRNGHAIVSSSSLIPENDPSLMFANAGMNQFKNLFLGLEQRDFKRAVSVQKCVRAGGKHNDLENVGFTARHHTFFEMLGNFSFGDYFKKEAIHFAWELLTKDLAIPKEKLYVTVFETDDEAADIWHKQEGVPRERIFRLGEKDNFWRMGDTGPCGPCTEIFYDHGPKAGRIADPFEGIKAGEDRFVEIWNLVFMQFFEKSPGVMDPLPKPSVDTGSGLERVTAALQGKMNNYDTDLFMPMIEKACQLGGWNIQKLLELESKSRDDRSKAEIDGHRAAQVQEDLAALRVLADHTRSGSFLIADGALPSNEGRGYVLRRILRRAIRYGRKISEKHSFLPEMSLVLIETMGSVYPELKARKDLILSILKDEESRFLQTLDQGTQILEEEMRRLKSQGQKQISGEFLFRLYDTYGFPSDLTQLMAAEKNFTVDESSFETHMQAAREKAKASWKGKGLSTDEGHLVALAQKVLDQHKASSFSGYDGTTGNGEIIALSNGSAEAATLSVGQAGVIVTNSTPFYAEGGGQVGDQGDIKTTSGHAKVLNTVKVNSIVMHQVEVLSGQIKSGEKASLAVSSSERRLTASNHSATHLLHAALRLVLGTHVTQAGSLVDSQKLRFDFTHNKSLTADEIAKIERLVNAEVSNAVPVQATTMKHKEAIAAGALALFGEKYGDEVRVLKMGDFSTELCGGTHVNNTAQIRLFKLVSETGVSAGVRRIEALTSDGAFNYLMKHASENLRARSATGLNESWSTFLESKAESSDWIESAKNEIKALEKEVRKAQSGSISVETLLQGARTFSAKGAQAQLVMADLAVEDRDVLAQVTDQLKNKIPSGVIVVVGQGSGSHPVIVSVTKNLNPEISAGNILKEVAAAMGGKGGGRPDFAQGAAPDRSKIKEAFAKASSLLGSN
jgi:alanyl-tRNA synthetase